MRRRTLILLSRPWAKRTVALSPAPSTVRIAESSNGETKKALAAWER